MIARMLLPHPHPRRRWWLLLALLGTVWLAHGASVAQEPPPAPAAVAAGHPHGGPEAHREAVAGLLLGLTIILIAAKVAGEVFERAKQPAVLGEILAGIILGNLALLGLGNFFEQLERHEVLLALSEVGVILLLFEVGLESDLQEMWRVGASSLLVATLGVVTPFFLGWGVSAWLLPQESPLVHVFIGATLCATSVGITARVLRDMGQLQRAESRIVLGAAVVDDVMGLVVLAVVQGIIRAAAEGGTLQAGEIAILILKALAFLIGAIVLGRLLAPRLFRLASYLSGQHILLVVSLGFCFALAWLANEIGLAFIVGAFAAGLILDPVVYREFAGRGEHRLEELIRPTAALLVPVFFVMTGMAVDLRVLGNAGTLVFAGVLTVAAILGKQACSLGVVERSLDRLTVGLGMIPRGEVGLIFATIGRGLFVVQDGMRKPIIGDDIFGAVVVMVMVTTLITPPLLAWSIRRRFGKSEAGA